MLVILDGWGLANASASNAVSVAKTPNFDLLWSRYPHLKLIASGEGVGLPKGQMGNSEVGHLNIGAGRVILQDLPRINAAISDGSFFTNKVLADTFAYAKEQNKPVHIMGLVSDGGVHSHVSHLFALLEYAKKSGVHQVYVHVFTDGRDVEPQSALRYVNKLDKEMRLIGVGKIATISGRYYTMDRDNRWDRTQLAYEAIVAGHGELADTAIEAVNDNYARGLNDEFIRPTVIDPAGVITDGDAVITFNFRSDRPRQICRAIIDQEFNGFKRSVVPKKLHFVTMTEYDPLLKTDGVVFPYEELKNVLSETVSAAGLSQFHIAETEKYAHVTFFFDGGKEKASKGEDRILIPSPKVATYDQKPEMSAPEVAKTLLTKIGKYDFIVVNFANADMVGHTGKMKAAVKACEAVDIELDKIVNAALESEYNVIVTADHGNAEKMLNNDGSPCTSHTTNPVPFILVTNEMHKLRAVNDPRLGNIAPTILGLMKLTKPKEMTESSLCLM